MVGQRKAGSYAIEGRAFEAPALSPGLYVVATPIGHLGDMSLRGLATLAAADLVACEDTRVTGKLLQRYALKVPLASYHEHNAEKQRPRLMAELERGGSVALVSDAGTPLISDPGYRLVREAAEAGYAVIPIPGASALLAGLVASGLPTDSFFFAGFLPPKSAARRKRLADLAAIPGTLVFYESPRRTAGALADMASELGGERDAVVARELTKTFETVRRATLAELAKTFAEEPEPKGEIVVLVAPPLPVVHEAADLDRDLAKLLRTMSAGEAAATLAARTGLPRRDLYQRVLALKEASDD